MCRPLPLFPTPRQEYFNRNRDKRMAYSKAKRVRERGTLIEPLKFTIRYIEGGINPFLST